MRHRYDCTVEQISLCSHAIERDSQNVKAYVRAGHAKLGLQQPNNAADMFRQALNLDASSAAAQVSFASAVAASNAQ